MLLEFIINLCIIIFSYSFFRYWHNLELIVFFDFQNPFITIFILIAIIFKSTRKRLTSKFDIFCKHWPVGKICEQSPKITQKSDEKGFVSNMAQWKCWNWNSHMFNRFLGGKFSVFYHYVGCFLSGFPKAK